MKAVSLLQISQWTAGVIKKSGQQKEINHVTIDSRQVKKGSLFVPLKGERVDGHAFLSQAAENGAVAALVEAGYTYPASTGLSMAVIEVDNTLLALQQLAAAYRDQFQIPVIGITGSNGKTTTKDLISSVLSVKYCVHKNKGNYNNHIGLPLTLLELEPAHQCAVLEMGMSGMGEISELSRLAKPSLALVTNVGWAHVENLGNRENIAEAKMEILEGLQSDGILIINGDDEYLFQQIERRSLKKSVLRVGFSPGLEMQAQGVEDLAGEGFAFRTNKTGENVFRVMHPGMHHVIGGLFAVLTGQLFRMTPEEIQEGLNAFEPSGMRMEMIHINQCELINDAYNANPDSVKAALKVLKSRAGNRRFAVLGSMFELGEDAEWLHRELAHELMDGAVDVLITVGEMARWIALEAAALEMKTNELIIFETQTPEEAAAILSRETREKDVILIKGSRAMAMERIVVQLMEGDM
ncbi:UDP-N-acetylmuramoyl-tripeptide--D-alanyl-D-alanine ligase [Anoxynatronum sibiricum]|uniref:UDP-N-acetylmuramoyl-tripeptide--D-alanyl-D-alanine ligase n=1 Tax=Anoxynatronum sibiricum TaxID=210623 RepID=A0ABU9VTS7_9CLOT